MFCPHCEVHFSGSRGVGLCPYCGKTADSSGHGPRSGQEVLVEEVAGGPASRRVEDAFVSKHGGEALSHAARGDTTLTEASEDWAPGALVAGKYEVVSRLGAGGFGTVYKVRHIFRKKYYALKTPHVEFARNKTFRLRFEREIEAMERFVHADAVMIRDSGVTESGLPYFTMDFIEGESLKVVLRREGRLKVDRALRVIRRTLRVLEIAHEKQIIHRDIKPDNILLTVESGRETVKVLDFGVAKLLDLVGDTGSITHGMRVGTPKYMSPEQVNADPLDSRSDLFALGIVFYEITTGTHPFAQQDDPVRVTAAILSRDPRPPRELVPDLPKAINDHILWMLEKRVKKRPASATVLIKQLGAVEEGVSQVESLESLAVCPAVERLPATNVVLRQETSVGERRIFFFFGERFTFGRSNDPRKNIRNDLIWRCLPCRSRSADPENWQRNLTISQRLGEIYPDGSTLVIEPSPGAKYGIGIAGVRSSKPARIQGDRFHISLGDRALELDGYRVLRNRDRNRLDLAFLAEARPEEAPEFELVGYSNPACLIDNVHFQRASNWPLHEYFFVYRQVYLGSSANVGLCLRGAGVEGVHASIIFERGEAFLLPLAERIVVQGRLDDPGAAGRGELEVPPNCLLPLRPGLQLRVGDVHLVVDAVEDSTFKAV